MIEKDGIEKIFGSGGRKGAMTDILLKKIEENADSVFNEKDACRNYVYILQCRDNSLYTGWTNDIGKGRSIPGEEDRCIWYIWRFFPPEKKR